MTESEIMDEIRSVFRKPMNEDLLFRFEILQHSGFGSKCLSIPEVSSSYEWSASSVAGKKTKSPIYILALDKLKVYVSGDSKICMGNNNATLCIGLQHICDRVCENQPYVGKNFFAPDFANISPDRPSLQIWSRYYARRLRYGYFNFGLLKTRFFKTAIFVQADYVT